MLLARLGSPLLVWLASISLLLVFIGVMTVQFVGGARLLETADGILYDTDLLIFRYQHRALYRLRRHEASGKKLRHIDLGLVAPTGVNGILMPKFMTSFLILVCFGVIGYPIPRYAASPIAAVKRFTAA